ncbi:Uncharacterised protein [Vibrio cholerae]|nr:Uncharacterised protein [Vibrio cholerae]CSI61118.1 Uncharacterised protein [Vibrio cholerae]
MLHRYYEVLFYVKFKERMSLWLCTLVLDKRRDKRISIISLR